MHERRGRGETIGEKKRREEKRRQKRRKEKRE
jgi:hypothetical protein